MKFTQLEAFVEVVESGGFAAAARVLGQTRSRVNREVLELENSLGSQLLSRTTRKVTPTALGLSFYERAKDILAAAKEARSVVDVQAHTAKGRLRISAPLSFGMQALPPIVDAFTADHPDVEFDLQLDDRIVDIASEGFDLALRIGPVDEDSDDVDFRLAQMPVSVVASPAFLATNPVHRPEDLTKLPWLAYGSYWKSPELPFEGQALKLKPALISNNGELLAEFAVQGKGVTCLPHFILNPFLQKGLLATVLTDWDLPRLQLAAVYPRTRYLSLKVRLFTDFLLEWFGSNEATPSAPGPNKLRGIDST